MFEGIDVHDHVTMLSSQPVVGCRPLICLVSSGWCLAQPYSILRDERFVTPVALILFGMLNRSNSRVQSYIL